MKLGLRTLAALVVASVVFASSPLSSPGAAHLAENTGILGSGSV
jgi:hypothetical protein